MVVGWGRIGCPLEVGSGEKEMMMKIKHTYYHQSNYRGSNYRGFISFHKCIVHVQVCVHCISATTF